MKKILILIMLTISCKKVTNNGTNDTDNKDVIVNVDVPTSVHSTQKFEGLYYFQEVDTDEISGALEVTVHYDGTVTITQKQVFKSLNPASTGYGTHPTIGFSRITPVLDTFNYTRDITYTANQDLEEDVSGSDLGAGKHYTSYIFWINADNKLRFTIKIHEGASSDAGGINDLVIERKFVEI